MASDWLNRGGDVCISSTNSDWMVHLFHRSLACDLLSIIKSSNRDRGLREGSSQHILPFKIVITGCILETWMQRFCNYLSNRHKEYLEIFEHYLFTGWTWGWSFLDLWVPRVLLAWVWETLKVQERRLGVHQVHPDLQDVRDHQVYQVST